jgi:hypothetical protein
VTSNSSRFLVCYGSITGKRLYRNFELGANEEVKEVKEQVKEMKSRRRTEEMEINLAEKALTPAGNGQNWG